MQFCFKVITHQRSTEGYRGGKQHLRIGIDQRAPRQMDSCTREFCPGDSSELPLELLLRWTLLTGPTPGHMYENLVVLSNLQVPPPSAHPYQWYVWYSSNYDVLSCSNLGSSFLRCASLYPIFNFEKWQFFFFPLKSYFLN